MASVIINIYQAKASLSQLVDRAEKGEEIIIAKSGRPMAKIVPLHAKHTLRSPGGWDDQVFISDDFDEPLPESILKAFEG